MIWVQKEPSRSQVRSRTLKLLFQKLINSGWSSYHSGIGETLRLEIERLEEAGIPYQLTAYPGYGYTVKRIPPLDFMKDGEAVRKEPE